MTGPVAAPALKVRTVRLDGPPPGVSGLLDLLSRDGGVLWSTGGPDGSGLVGRGEAARCDLVGPDPFGRAQAWWRSVVAAAHVEDDVGLPGTGLVALGSFAFDAASRSSVLLVPQVLVGRRDRTWWVTTVDDAVADLSPVAPPGPAPVLVLGPGSRSDADWQGAVAEAVGRIRAGRLHKVVLARDVHARLDAPVDVRRPLGVLSREYPACWTFSVDGLLGATPEPLLRLRDGQAVSRVLAGTSPRQDDATIDATAAATLTASAKDVEEHAYAVTSVAVALAEHCTDVDVPEHPFVLELPNVRHLATDVRGTVADGASALRLLGSLHPTAAVCGTPTPAALALVREVEGLDRGRYAGPVGWVDAAGDGEWCIALRCAEVDPQDPTHLRLFAGGGIVGGSDPAAELAETEAKLRPMRQALGG